MHIHSAGLTAGAILGAILAAALLPACRERARVATVAGPVVAVAAARPDATPPRPAAAAARLAACNGRPGCSESSRQIVASGNGLALVQLKIVHSPKATSDDERCDRREYWLERPAGDVLLAADCAEQWGADNPGPAETRLAGSKFVVKYVEFQSSDDCEIFTATVQLSPLAVEAQQRSPGVVKANRCQPGKSPKPTPPLPLGDGSLDHPLLVLHR